MLSLIPTKPVRLMSSTKTSSKKIPTREHLWKLHNALIKKGHPRIARAVLTGELSDKIQHLAQTVDVTEEAPLTVVPILTKDITKALGDKLSGAFVASCSSVLSPPADSLVQDFNRALSDFLKNIFSEVKNEFGNAGLNELSPHLTSLTNAAVEAFFETIRDNVYDFIAGNADILPTLIDEVRSTKAALQTDTPSQE